MAISNSCAGLALSVLLIYLFHIVISSIFISFDETHDKMHAVTLLAGVVTQRSAYVGFTAATGAGDQQVLAPEPPFALAQLCDT